MERVSQGHFLCAGNVLVSTGRPRTVDSTHAICYFSDSNFIAIFSLFLSSALFNFLLFFSFFFFIYFLILCYSTYLLFDYFIIDIVRHVHCLDVSISIPEPLEHTAEWLCDSCCQVESTE